MEGFEVFQKELKEYFKEYRKVLHVKYSKVTITKHTCILQDFIDYTTSYEGCTDLSQITKGMTASGLARYINSQGDESYTSTTVKNIVTSFLLFIKEKYGIYNSKLTP